MFAAKSLANEFFLRGDAVVRTRRDVRRRADDLPEPSRVGFTAQPRGRPARPWRNPQTARRRAPPPRRQERVEWRAQVPRSVHWLGQHFELRRQGQSTEWHGARLCAGHQQNRVARPPAAGARKAILPRAEEFLLPLQLALPDEQTRIDKQFVVTLRKTKAEPHEVRRDVWNRAANERSPGRGRFEDGKPNPSWIEVNNTASLAASSSLTPGLPLSRPFNMPRRKRHPARLAAAARPFA